MGFDPDPAKEGAPEQGFGMLGMQERAALVGATVDIESTAGNATTLYLPIANATDPAHITRNSNDHA